MPTCPDGEDIAVNAPETLSVQTLLIPDFISPLTVIKAHAQLIRRRVASAGARETAQIERSVEAIEHAVQRIVAALAESDPPAVKER